MIPSDARSNASLSAIPRSGYQFQKWECEGIANPLFPFTTARMTADLNITAIFIAKPLVGNLHKIERIAEDWYSSSWFGTFFQSEEGWAYHIDFGWIYPTVDSSANVWFWHVELGWVWVNEETFSAYFIWSNINQDWLYWNNFDVLNSRYFDYAFDQWFEWQK